MNWILQWLLLFCMSVLKNSLCRISHCDNKWKTLNFIWISRTLEPENWILHSGLIDHQFLHRYLIFTGIPSVLIPDSTYSVVTGSDITIPCTVSATPSATTVSWQRIVNSVTTTLTIDGSKFTGGSVATPSLNIKDTDNSDQGFYVCSATNIVGSGQSSQSYLTVTGSK